MGIKWIIPLSQFAQTEGSCGNWRSGVSLFQGNVNNLMHNVRFPQCLDQSHTSTNIIKTAHIIIITLEFLELAVYKLPHFTNYKSDYISKTSCESLRRLEIVEGAIEMSISSYEKCKLLEAILINSSFTSCNLLITLFLTDN